MRQSVIRRAGAAPGAGMRPSWRAAPAEDRDLLDSIAPLLLALFFASLVIPGSVSFAGLNLSPYRIVLLLLFVPLSLRWISGRAGPVTAADLAVMGYCLWVGFALVANHGLGRIHTVGTIFAEYFGGYLVGRTLIRNSDDFRTFIRYFGLAILFLLPFALIEFVTGTSLLRAIFRPFLSVPDRFEAGFQPRLGFRERVQGPFGHSILFGLFCSLAVANLFYVYRNSLMKRVSGSFLAALMVFLSLSSGPLLSVALQIGMTGWDIFLRFLRSRWIILAVGSVSLVSIIHFATPGGIFVFVFENLLLVPLTGYARLEILHWGMLSVLDNPLFGVGLNDWERAFWMGHPTIDNFWLLTAVLYGLPSLLFLWTGIGLSMLRSLTNRDLDEEAAAFRRGYSIALVALVLMLSATAVWGAISTFVLTYIGAGAWFGERRTVPASAIHRGPAKGAGAPGTPSRRQGGAPPDDGADPPKDGRETGAAQRRAGRTRTGRGSGVRGT